MTTRIGKSEDGDKKDFGLFDVYMYEKKIHNVQQPLTSCFTFLFSFLVGKYQPLSKLIEKKFEIVHR